VVPNRKRKELKTSQTNAWRGRAKKGDDVVKEIVFQKERKGEPAKREIPHGKPARNEGEKQMECKGSAVSIREVGFRSVQRKRLQKP